jgi:hypothetical protein
MARLYFDRVTTPRGFTRLDFEDLAHSRCSLQESSLASAIWLGISKIEPLILASQAASHGVETTQTTGWVPFPVPEGVLLHGRMHLDQSQARDLAKRLLRFAELGVVL